MFHRKKKQGQKQLKQEIGVNKRSPYRCFIIYLRQIENFSKKGLHSKFSLKSLFRVPRHIHDNWTWGRKKKRKKDNHQCWGNSSNIVMNQFVWLFSISMFTIPVTRKKRSIKRKKNVTGNHKLHSWISRTKVFSWMSICYFSG